MSPTSNSPLVSVVIPCLNEEDSAQKCLKALRETILRESISAEVIVVDNGSTDRSAPIIEEEARAFPGLRLVREERRGYGSACLRGFREARGEIIYMADMDGTYDFSDIPRFVDEISKGNDLVVGNRFSGGIDPGAMPPLHRFLGNPLLSTLVRVLFKAPLGDMHCGARAITRRGFEAIGLRTSGMEFASEMIVKSAKQRLRMAEIPVRYRARTGASKLRSFSDGWRHLRFILLCSPVALFLAPGIALSLTGALGLIVFLLSDPTIFGMHFYVHPMFPLAATVIIGYQLVLFSAFSKAYAFAHLGERSPLFERALRVVTLERACVAGMLIALVGTAVYASVFIAWAQSGFGSLDAAKSSIVALTLIALGVQTIFSSFMISTLGIQEL